MLRLKPWPSGTQQSAGRTSGAIMIRDDPSGNYGDRRLDAESGLPRMPLSVGVEGGGWLRLHVPVVAVVAPRPVAAASRRAGVCGVPPVAGC